MLSILINFKHDCEDKGLYFDPDIIWDNSTQRYGFVAHESGQCKSIIHYVMQETLEFKCERIQDVWVILLS